MTVPFDYSDSFSFSVLTVPYILDAYALISGHPGDIRGNSAGFADFCRQFLAQDRGIGPLLHYRGKIHGERPAGFVTSPPS